MHALHDLVLSPMLSQLFTHQIQLILPPIHDRVCLDLIPGRNRVLPLRLNHRSSLPVVTVRVTCVTLSPFIEASGRLPHLDVVKLLLERYLFRCQIIMYALTFPVLLVLDHQLHKDLLVLATQGGAH